MVLLFSAMISEVFKAAYQAIPKGQLEAGLSIGLTSEQTFVRIIALKHLRLLYQILQQLYLTLCAMQLWLIRLVLLMLWAKGTF